METTSKKKILLIRNNIGFRYWHCNGIYKVSGYEERSGNHYGEYRRIINKADR